MTTTADHAADAMRMMNDLQAAMAEPWDPELAPYVTTSGNLGLPMIGHPLIHEIMPIPGVCNARLRAKQAALAEAEAAEDWHSCVFLHERPYRTDALIDYVVGRDEFEEPGSLMGRSQEVRDLAADVWVDSENLHQHEAEWACMFAGASGLVMASEQEAAEFAAMPDTLTIYRGDCDDGGWSWSLDPKIASFFAKRFDADHALLVAEVAKSDVFGYLSRRGESEVLIHEGSAQNERPYEEES